MMRDERWWRDRRSWCSQKINHQTEGILIFDNKIYSDHKNVSSWTCIYIADGGTGAAWGTGLPHVNSNAAAVKKSKSRTSRSDLTYDTAKSSFTLKYHVCFWVEIGVRKLFLFAFFHLVKPLSLLFVPYTASKTLNVNLCDQELY